MGTDGVVLNRQNRQKRIDNFITYLQSSKSAERREVGRLARIGQEAEEMTARQATVSSQRHGFEQAATFFLGEPTIESEMEAGQEDRKQTAP